MLTYLFPDIIIVVNYPVASVQIYIMQCVLHVLFLKALYQLWELLQKHLSDYTSYDMIAVVYTGCLKNAISGSRFLHNLEFLVGIDIK
jgi:hypothetical protein